jgi:hypothetical protein
MKIKKLSLLFAAAVYGIDLAALNERARLNKIAGKTLCRGGV